MPETLSNLGTSKVSATEETNVTGQMTPILTLSPDDGLQMIIDNQGGRGVPVYASLQDSGGNDLPLDTNLTLRWNANHLDQAQVVAFTLDNIRQYRTLSIKDQQNEEYRERTRIRLKGPELVVEDIEELEVAVESSAQIDWSNSQLYIDENAVTVQSGD